MAPLMTDPERLEQARISTRAGRRTDLNDIAHQLMEHPVIERVELFGSFARGDGTVYFSDYDLIIVVNEELALAWLDELHRYNGHFTKAFGSDTYSGRKYERYGIAEDLLGPLPGSIWATIDLFVFPPNWKDEAELIRLQNAGDHHDPNFMRNIARDAITFDPTTGSFPWP